LERLLERHGDERLHLLRGEPEAVGLDLYLGLGKLREDVDGRVPQHTAAEDHDGQPRGDDDVPEPKTGRDDPAHQWPLSAPTPDSAPESSATPAIGALVPVSGPFASTALAPSIVSTTIRCRTKVRPCGFVYVQ